VEGNVDRSNPEEARYIALGHRNAEVIDLFQRFCGNVRVEVSGGTGMLEAATGLPIGHRAFRCAHASGNIMSGMMLEDLAVEFYEQHCRGCAFRVRSGLLGDTIATVADARRADQEDRNRRENDEAAERHRQRDERAARRSRRGAGEQYQSVTQLQYVDKLDAADSSPEAADVEWLVRTASLAPEVISDAAAAELVELAGDPRVPWGTREAAQAVLVPLTTAGRTPATATAPVAIANLAEGPGHQAGRLLVAAADAVEADAVTMEVARSAALLAGATSDPVARVMSRFTHKPVVADPAPLLLCAARNLEAVLRAVELMLAAGAPAPNPPVVLVGPDGQPLRPSVGEAPGIPDEGDRSRSIAAAACLPLIEATPTAVPRLVEALARSLELPDHDMSAAPSNVISRTLGLALLRQYDTAAPSLLESARRISAEARKELFEAISSALHADPGPGEPDTRPRIVQLAVDRLQGDWGERAATEAAVTLRDQARFHPERIAGHASALVGALVVEITQPVPPPTVLAASPPDTLARIEEFGRRQDRQIRISSLRSAVGYLVQAGADDAVTAVFSLLDTEDDGSEDAVGVRAAATRLLGDIGSRPVHLPAVVPRLYTGLLHAEPRIRLAAIRSWEDLACLPQTLPSTLLDLLPVLLTDGSAVLTALKLIGRLDIPLERRAALLPLVMGAADAAHGAALNDPESAIEACTGALLSLANGLPGQEPEAPAYQALVVADRLSAYGQRDLLLSWWPPRVANSGLFAQRALSVLAAPEFADPFSGRDYRVQAALLGCPYGTGRQPLERFLTVTNVHLPDHPWPTLEMIEVLQRAARWDDAAQVAEHISASIPQDREHQARLDLAAAVAEIAAGEAALRTGTVPTAPATPAQSGQALDEILARFAAAADARHALQTASKPQPPQRLAELAAQLDSAAEVIAPARREAPVVVTETAWAAWAGALRCTAHLLRWDAATQEASGDAARHLQAARRRAEVAFAGLPAGSGDDPLLQQAAGLTAKIAAVQEPGGIAELAHQLALIPLPLRVIREERDWSYRPPTADGEASQPAAPAVGICRLDGVLVTNAHVLRPDEVHDLGVEIRVTQWPDQATALEVTFLSVLSPDQARLPSFTFPRIPPDEDGICRLSGSGSLSVSFTLPAGAPPLAFPVAARFTGPGLDEVLPVAGHSELWLRPFDATTDGLTRRPQLDERLADMYTVLHGKNLNADDVQAFCRLYTAIAGKAVDIQFERSYMRKQGGGVTERSFHDDLFDRLLADPALQGRVQRGIRAAAGFLDIAHDRINAELKVAKKTAVTVETSHKYLGQAADYAADTGSQLSILVVLDMTQTRNPPGVLENYLGFMQPALAGLHDPRFPALVGVIVIKGSLLIPSGYSRGPGGPASRIGP
jgi:hypothetical protein